MSTQIVPFVGAKLYLYTQFKEPVLNLVIDGMDPSKEKFYIGYRPFYYIATAAVLDSLKKEMETAIKSVDGYYKHSKLRNDRIVYMITGEKVLKRSKSRNKHKLKQSKSKQTYPKIVSTVSYKSPDYNLRVKKLMRPATTIKSVNPALVAQYISMHGIDSFSVSGSTDEELLSALREELVAMRSPITVSPSLMKTALRAMYMSPILMYSALTSEVDLKHMPTELSITRRYNAIKTAIETTNASPFAVMGYSLDFQMPAVNIEEYRTLMLQSELAIVPEFRDRRCVLIQALNGDDPLFSKIVEHVNIVTDGGNGKVYLDMTYGMLVDVGPVFTLGEAYALNKRLKWVL